MIPEPINDHNDNALPRLYRGLQGASWLSYTELMVLIAQLPNYGTLIEVGTASGVSAHIIAKSHPNLDLYCIDNFASIEVDPPQEYANKEVKRKDHWVSNALPNMQLFTGTLEEFHKSPYFPELPIVFIDGDHSFEGVSADLAVVAKFRPSTVFLHDYEDPTWTGVKPAVDAFIVDQHYSIVNRCNSLVTLKRKGAQ
jgi:hypothetical protein